MHLAIQTKKCVYCVEIKRQNSIGEKVVGECEEKISRLKVKKDRTVRPVLVYDGVRAVGVVLAHRRAPS